LNFWTALHRRNSERLGRDAELLGGLLGGIPAIPLTVALRVVMFRYVLKKREA